MPTSYREVAHLQGSGYDAAMLAPYGTWKSAITPSVITGASVNLSAVTLAGPDLFWLEQRPLEGGRSVLVRNGVDVTPLGLSVRSRVHEYGGGAYTLAGNDVIFVNDTDQQLYRNTAPLTHVPGLRFADMLVDRHRILAVCEDHRTHPREPINSLVAITNGHIEPLAAGNDFYSSPRVCGEHLAYLTWKHPNMPWDETELWLDGQLIAGGASIFQPEWSPTGELHFISDQTGWWNLYRYRAGKIESLLEMPAEFGAPQWNFGMSTYAFLADGRIVCAFNERGQWRLGIFDGQLHPLDLPYTEISSVRAAGNTIAFIAASPTEPAAVVRLDFVGAPSQARPVSASHPDGGSDNLTVVRRSTTVALDARSVSVAEPIECGGVHAFYYPPVNADFSAPAGELPPLIVFTHGGPTSATTSGLNLLKQFWTSRGFAVVDVNYGGSAGFGRAYRQRLNGQWGIVDVDDCCAVAQALVAAGNADPLRLIIRGGSAGGYTTLCALTFRQVFQTGASYFGIGDLEAMLETHKFESRYLDGLLAQWPAGREIYEARSPLRHLDQLHCPIIFFQGLDDKVVLPDQSQQMVAAMKAKGLFVEYLEFAGESHGFRQAATIQQTLGAELAFYQRVLGIPVVKP